MQVHAIIIYHQIFCPVNNNIDEQPEIVQWMQWHCVFRRTGYLQIYSPILTAGTASDSLIAFSFNISGSPNLIDWISHAMCGQGVQCELKLVRQGRAVSLGYSATQIKEQERSKARASLQNTKNTAHVSKRTWLNMRSSV